MEQLSNIYTKGKRVEPYWYVIAVFGLIMAVILINHLITGFTPSRIAFQIEVFNFSIFWYGIFIVGGIAMGSWVTARLAAERAQFDFKEHVPPDLRKRPLKALKLPEEIQRSLVKRKVLNLGNLLFEWGLSPDRLGLNKQGKKVVESKLKNTPNVLEGWIYDAPWRQWNPDFVWGGVAWVILLGVIGARLYHVLTPSPSMTAEGIFSALDYFRNPMQLINIRSGGLGIYGAIIGGFLGLLLYTHRHHISTIAWADLAVVGMALGQFIGRWGNFFNQELYGGVTNLPWGITIINRVPGTVYADIERFPIDSTRFHPAFLYESLWSLLTFIVLLTLARRRRDDLQTGDLLALYLVFYAVGRILLELIRLDSRTLSLAGIDLGIPVATLVSIIIAVPMAFLLLWRHLIARN
ncbi:MAG TPA: prolipoprotein diacylglyceryl transferase [Chloroflexi bacterium]|nr:prolipoprotein diacylglyceryl transferase [Chloroflexota bacterium]